MRYAETAIGTPHTHRATVTAETGRAGVNGPRWVSWLLGCGLLGSVVAAALHYSEQQAFVRLAQRAEPWWLAAALACQAGTYLAQAAIWRRVAAAGGYALPARVAFELSLVKLFTDQTLPSAGLSSNNPIAAALERRGVPPPAVKASVLINLVSYHFAQVAALTVALSIVMLRGQLNAVVLIASIVFILFSVGLSAAVFAMAGRPRPPLAPALLRIRAVHPSLDFVAGADPRLVRRLRVQSDAVWLQLAIVMLDTATLWMLIAALGDRAAIGGVFASFMVASLFRTMGIVPGGLGVFEVTSVVMLRNAGIDLEVALSATLLYRGLSFWLPMLPGYWVSRRALAARETSSAGCTPVDYWALDADDLVTRLQSNRDGLSSPEAARRLRAHGPNQLRQHQHLSRITVLGRQLRSPLLLLLLFAAGASALTSEWFDASIVLTIVITTVAFGYSREYTANAAAAALRVRLRTRAAVMRDGVKVLIPLEEIVPGDVVLLSAGSLVPADAVLLDATDFYVSEAVLTGESFPVMKTAGAIDRATALARRSNCVFLGTNVRSGTACCLVVSTGPSTEFGAIAHRLTLRPPETEFDRGVRRFGYLLTVAMLTMVLIVFVAHMLLGRLPVETLLFSIALAVGLSPELLPAILSVNLARGAQMMARHGVLVRHLSAIENLGSMNVLCTDKTGTITEGVVQLEGAYDGDGQRSAPVLQLGAWNAALETGIASPLDEAILAACAPDLVDVRKIAEVPFDFIRKRVTIVAQTRDGVRLVTKGSFDHVLDVCVATADGSTLDDTRRAQLADRCEAWTRHGIRVLAVAERSIPAKTAYGPDDERDMTFAGFLTFLDRPKEGVADTIRELAALGVSIKVITGDSRLVAEHVAGRVGLRVDRVLTGRQLDELHDEALWSAAEKTDIFAEVDPNQKERIILALKKMGHVVGFLGDGVNDAPAMHAADTSLSVEQAVDVAREAADFVLLERGLDVIRRGIEEGRKTFANTLKYVLITTSANLGNMVSMAAASILLPFLPLTAGQILLNNFLSDIPAVGLADDSVDRELVDRPRRWDIGFIGRFMVEFGALSSLFDFLTFGALLVVLHATPDEFRTTWFVESLLTELAIAIVVRTRRPFFRSMPGTLLLTTTVALIPIALAVPYTPFASIFGFVALRPPLLIMIVTITVLYVIAAELQKRWFYQRVG